ncbi:hypothetical protein BGZ83_008110 [Gryganskiella cystojenkinii]|nr:hypothetical protein BGZ83_008110 [Gryganskiella cystojenkinii]
MKVNAPSVLALAALIGFVAAAPILHVHVGVKNHESHAAPETTKALEPPAPEVTKAPDVTVKPAPDAPPVPETTKAPEPPAPEPTKAPEPPAPEPTKVPVTPGPDAPAPPPKGHLLPGDILKCFAICKEVSSVWHIAEKCVKDCIAAKSKGEDFKFVPPTTLPFPHYP